MWLSGIVTYTLFLLPDVWHALLWLVVLVRVIMRKDSGSVQSKGIYALICLFFLISYVDPSDIDMTEAQLAFKAQASSEMPKVIRVRRFIQEMWVDDEREYRFAHRWTDKYHDLESRVRARNTLYAFFVRKAGATGEDKSSASQSLWEIGHFADKGGIGDKIVMTYGEYFAGKLTGSADTNTKDASLYAKVVVVSKNEIYLTLHSDRKGGQFKNSDQVKYIVSIKTSKGKETLTGWNSSDRIKLSPQSSLKLHNHWINNEIIGFSIRKSDGLDTLTRYSFKMKNYPGYKETYAKLK